MYSVHACCHPTLPMYYSSQDLQHHVQQYADTCTFKRTMIDRQLVSSMYIAVYNSV